MTEFNFLEDLGAVKAGLENAEYMAMQKEIIIEAKYIPAQPFNSVEPSFETKFKELLKECIVDGHQYEVFSTVIVNETITMKVRRKR